MASDAMKITPRPRSRLRMPFSWVVGDLASQVLMLSSTLWMGSRPKACMSCLDIIQGCGCYSLVGKDLSSPGLTLITLWMVVGWQLTVSLDNFCSLSMTWID